MSTAMRMARDEHAAESVASQIARDEQVKLLRKLRWIGADEEAERVVRDLKRHDAPAADSVLATPRDTD